VRGKGWKDFYSTRLRVVLAAPSELNGLSLANNKLFDMYIWKRCIFIKLCQPSYFIVLVQLCGIEVQIFLVDNNSHTICICCRDDARMPGAHYSAKPVLLICPSLELCDQPINLGSFL